MNTRRGWVIGVLSLAVAVAIGFAAGWFVRGPSRERTTAGDEYGGTALVSGQLLVDKASMLSPAPVPGEVQVGNIHQVGPPMPRAEATSDGAFSMYLDPGSYTVFGVSPMYQGGKGTCRADQVPNSTITVRVGDHISFDLLCR